MTSYLFVWNVECSSVSVCDSMARPKKGRCSRQSKRGSRVVMVSFTIVILGAIVAVVVFSSSTTKAKPWEEAEKISYENDFRSKLVLDKKAKPWTYKEEDLNSWAPRVPVPKNVNQPGELGFPYFPELWEQPKIQQTWHLNEFNLWVSDRILLNRSLPDVRSAECKERVSIYADRLPHTSVIIVFHNEAWSTLLRSVWSIINRTPRSLLKEIILVDDASDKDFLKLQLEFYVASLPVDVRVIRTSKRSGLIKARVLGAAVASGQVLTFLDSHIECSEGWLEPLLARIVEDRTRVVCPIIDTVSDVDFEFRLAPLSIYGGFDWKLVFLWFDLKGKALERHKVDPSAPVATPTMAGGLFSIDREFFEYLGSYDDQFETWGGENTEISLRIWMCGGTIENCPCSHVGHIFRKKSPFKFPKSPDWTLNKNNARTAKVWLDEWLKGYFALNPGARLVKSGSVKARKQLRKKMNCKSFNWFLENIYPEASINFHYFNLGEVRLRSEDLCLDTESYRGGQPIFMKPCHWLGGNQAFAYTTKYEIRNDLFCLDGVNQKKPIMLVECNGRMSNQRWKYFKQNGTIVHHNTGLCLTLTEKHQAEIKPLLRKCSGDDSQVWELHGLTNKCRKKQREAFQEIAYPSATQTSMYRKTVSGYYFRRQT